jgi:hypothetical protein
VTSQEDVDAASETESVRDAVEQSRSGAPAVGSVVRDRFTSNEIFQRIVAAADEAIPELGSRYCAEWIPVPDANEDFAGYRDALLEAVDEQPVGELPAVGRLSGQAAGDESAAQRLGAVDLAVFACKTPLFGVDLLAKSGGQLDRTPHIGAPLA